MSQLSIFYPLVTVETAPMLRTPAEPIRVFDSEVEDFANVLLVLMYEYDGIGLAAPQLGEHIRMAAVTQWKEVKKGKAQSSKPKAKSGKEKGNGKWEIVGEYIIINPEILEHSTTTQVNEEACLSVPGVFGEVERFQWVKIKYQDVAGKEIIKKLNGFNAVVVQHEIDHLNGILFTDKVIRFTKG